MPLGIKLLLNVVKILAGRNGVMVNTHNYWTDNIELYQFYDKNIFNLRPQSHAASLAGILCEKGQSNIFGLLLYSTSEHNVCPPAHFCSGCVGVILQWNYY